MTSSALRKMSIATLVLSAVLALVAFRMTRDVPAGAAPSPVAMLPRVVAATRSLEAGAVIEAGDVSLREVKVAPAGAFEREEDVVHQSAAVAIAAGEPIVREDLTAASAIRAGLEPGERALAVKIDGVVGLGGFIEPGDRVDVVVYLKQDGRRVAVSQARMLLRDIRVLAYGSRTPKGREHDPSEARVAVLAVGEAQVPMLMLGAHEGQLRLALRGEAGGEHDAPDRPATVEDLLGGAPVPVGTLRASPIVIYRGSAREEVAP